MWGYESSEEADPSSLFFFALGIGSSHQAQEQSAGSQCVLVERDGASFMCFLW